MILKNYKNFIDILNANYTIKDNMFHLELGLKWLINSQINGYRHSFHFVYGWQKEYPETTGYIVPTMLKCYKLFKNDKYYNSAKKAIVWLKSIQNSDGSFNDLSNKRQVFDTGQILIGFNYIFENFKEFNIKENLTKSANWLVKVQENDGSWAGYAYNNIPHTYYSRVGWALIHAGKLLNSEKFYEAGKKNIEWVISQQKKNGFFNYASFDNNPAYLHTMIYILEGLLESYKLLKSENILDVVLKNSEALLELSKNGILCSQYNENFECVNNEKCLTGIAQWAGVCFDLYQITKKEEYIKEYEKNILFLKSHQIISYNDNINGGLAGSLPYNGSYMKYSIPNWSIKFFLDGLLKYVNTIK